MGIVDKVVDAVTSVTEKVAEAVGLKSADDKTAPHTRPPLRSIRGVVASDKGNKTIKVVVNYQTRHQKYGKYLKRRTTYQAHDEQNEAREGDRVEITECRPMSKTKHHRLLRVVERAPERAVQVSAEEVMTGKAPEAR